MNGKSLARRLILNSIMAFTGLGSLFWASSANAQNSFDTFWTKFRTAVIKGDRETAASLSTFPIRISSDRKHLPVILRSDFRRRYRFMFNKLADAARCFAREQPDRDLRYPKRYMVQCFSDDGHAVAFDFKHTKAGWKFFGMDIFALPD